MLVTHQVHLLDRCDQVIMVQDGRISAQGSPAELRQQGVDYTGQIAAAQKSQKEDEGDGKGMKKSGSTSSLAGTINISLSYHHIYPLHINPPYLHETNINPFTF